MLAVAVDYDEKALLGMDAVVDPFISEALRQNAEDILWMAKALCPVKTGALRASLHVEQTGEFEYAVRDGVPYGIFVEKGHRDPRTGNFVEPQPFLQPAVDRMSKRAKKRIKEAIKTAMGQRVTKAEAAQERSDARLKEIMQRAGVQRIWGGKTTSPVSKAHGPSWG